MYSNMNHNCDNAGQAATASSTAAGVVNAAVLDKFDRFEAWLRENGAHFDQVRCVFVYV